jgi:hypothetical protein
MAFPTNPTDGSTATINGVVYVYRASKNAWGPASIAQVSTINYTGNVAAANVNVTGNLYINSQIVPSVVQMMTYHLAL